MADPPPTNVAKLGTFFWCAGAGRFRPAQGTLSEKVFQHEPDSCDDQEEYADTDDEGRVFAIAHGSSRSTGDVE